jgi:hypothetical protein
VYFKETLKIEVSYFILISYTKKLGKFGIRENAALEGRVEARVCLYVNRDEFSYVSLRLLALGRKSHKCTKFIRKRTKL